MMPNPIVISNRNIVFVDPKEFDEPQVFDYPKGISIGNIAKGTTDPGVDCFDQ